jgi:hypothetical protein
MIESETRHANPGVPSTSSSSSIHYTPSLV